MMPPLAVCRLRFTRHCLVFLMMRSTTISFPRWRWKTCSRWKGSVSRERLMWRRQQRKNISEAVWDILTDISQTTRNMRRSMQSVHGCLPELSVMMETICRQSCFARAVSKGCAEIL